MHKKLASDLTSLAHSILQMKNKEDVLILSCEESRSQFRNKAIVTQRFLELISEGLKEEKERIPTKIPKAVQRKRLENKRKTSEKKANRKPPKVD